jgi:hypothetical protein
MEDGTATYLTQMNLLPSQKESITTGKYRITCHFNIKKVIFQRMHLVTVKNNLHH